MKFFPLASMMTVALVLGAAAPSMAETVTPISLQTGHSTVIEENGVQRLAVGDAKIAGVLPVGNRQIVINGKTPGRTTVFVWSRNGRETFEVTVTGQATSQFADMLRASIPMRNVEVAGFGKVAIVRGTVENAEESARLNDIVSRFQASLKGENISIVNVVSVRHPLGNLQQELSSVPGVQHLRVDADAKGNIVVSGAVQDRVAAERILGHVKGMAAPYLGVEGKVVDRLEVTDNTEIDIKVQVMEVDKTAQNQLGVSLQSGILDPTSGKYSYGPPQFPLIEGPAASQVGRGLNVSGAFFRLAFLAPTLTALINHGNAKMLSEPHLTTIPGQEASFLVGGELPYVVSTTLGQVSVQFKKYGVQLKVTPTILPNGAIQTKVNPQISDLDYQNSVQINGFSLPAIKKSELSTTAIAQPGQSIVMGGLLQHVEQKAISEFPILGQLPIIGKLFRSTTYQRRDSDVVFIMTPTIVNH